MKNKKVEILLIILLFNFLLVAVSFVPGTAPDIPVGIPPPRPRLSGAVPRAMPFGKTLASSDARLTTPTIVDRPAPVEQREIRHAVRRGRYLRMTNYLLA